MTIDFSVSTATHLFTKDCGYHLHEDSDMYCQVNYDDKFSWLSRLKFGLLYRNEFNNSAPVDITVIVLPSFKFVDMFILRPFCYQRVRLALF